MNFNYHLIHYWLFEESKKHFFLKVKTSLNVQIHPLFSFFFYYFYLYTYNIISTCNIYFIMIVFYHHAKTLIGFGVSA